MTSLIAGPEALVNTYIANFQGLPDVAALAGGGYVITWMSGSEDGSSNGIYAQRYDAQGGKVGGETLINTITVNSQRDPHITALGDGGYVIVWTDEGVYGSVPDEAYGQRYDAQGNTVGGQFKINTTAASYPETQVASLAGGGFVAAWDSTSADGTGWNISFQMYDAKGNTVGGEVQANTDSTYHHTEATVTGLKDGGFVVTWASDGQDGDLQGVYEQRYDAAGHKVGTETAVNATTDSYEDEATATALSDGGWVVTWNGPDTLSGNHVYMRHYDAQGHTTGPDVLANTYVQSNQGNPDIYALDNGGYVITWTSYSGQDGSGTGVYFQEFSATGAKIGSETLINDTTTGDQLYSTVTQLHNGTLVFTWEQDQNGEINVYQRLFHPAPIDGDENANTLNGTAGADTIDGLGGDDTINGLGGSDSIDGGTGADMMKGGLGDDTYFVDNTGDKVVEGNNAGTDLVISSVDFVIAGYVENVTLTGTGNIKAVGNGEANHLIGNTGNNLLNGGQGADTMEGGFGNDTYYVDNTGDVVIEGVSQGTDVVYSAITYTLPDNVETLILTGYNAVNATGNALGNTITGNNAANIINGGDGNDILRGLGGNDTLSGGAGSDSFVFQAPGGTNGLDHITDFATGVDKLIFHASDFGFTAGHHLTADEFHLNGRLGTNGQFIYNEGSHTLYWDPDGTGAANAVSIAVFDNSADLHASDFGFV